MLNLIRSDLFRWGQNVKVTTGDKRLIGLKNVDWELFSVLPIPVIYGAGRTENSIDVPTTLIRTPRIRDSAVDSLDNFGIVLELFE